MDSESAAVLVMVLGAAGGLAIAAALLVAFIFARSRDGEIGYRASFVSYCRECEAPIMRMDDEGQVCVLCGGRNRRAELL